MLKHPTLDKLQALKFTGMAAALAEQLQLPVDYYDPTINYEAVEGKIFGTSIPTQ